VIVAAATDTRMLDAYEQLGFTKGKSKRVYLTLP
jgi:hypothetical protein